MNTKTSYLETLPKDLTSGLVVFLVAIPLCLGIALASNAPLFSGILSGIVGGLVVAFISGSQTSVSGPAAGLTAIVAAQIALLGSYEAFLTAVVIAGIFQILLSIAQMGYFAAFFPSSVIKGLLWAIGALLILKQIPHILGHDADPIGDENFLQANDLNTFTEIYASFFDVQPAALLISVISIVMLIVWDKIEFLKKSPCPAPLAVVIFGIFAHFQMQTWGHYWELEPTHLVQVPVAATFSDFFNFLTLPDLSAITNPLVYSAAITIAAVASLETLLNLEAVDKIDKLQRSSPPNRELLAQGFGNIISGLIGGLPVTSVIIRSSVNINAGARTKLSAIFHGLLLLCSVIWIPTVLNQIPLAALAAILLMTGLKLANMQMISQMWSEGIKQFLPFIVTIIAIIFSDLLIGILIGLATSIYFILQSNIRRPIKKIMEKHTTGDEVLHIELPNQVSFFNRASLDRTLRNIPKGGHVLINADNSDYIDPDILDLISDFESNTAKAQNIFVSLQGFKDKYPQLEDKIQYVDVSNWETRETLTPGNVLEMLREGNQRFRMGVRLTRSVNRQLNVMSSGQYPIAVILSCIDSRTSTELIFDLSLGDVFSVRIAGNVVSHKVLGSIEYSCAVAGAKVVLVMGHTSCGAVKASVDLLCNHQTAEQVTGCVNLDSLIQEIQASFIKDQCIDFEKWSTLDKETYYNEISHKNILRSMRKIREDSSTLDQLVREGKIAIVGALYDISTGEVAFFEAVDMVQTATI